jgi:hypothetical protein
MYKFPKKISSLGSMFSSQQEFVFIRCVGQGYTAAG